MKRQQTNIAADSVKEECTNLQINGLNCNDKVLIDKYITLMFFFEILVTDLAVFFTH